MENSKTITASEGMILHNGAGQYAYEVIVPESVVWEQVPDTGQIIRDVEDSTQQKN